MGSRVAPALALMALAPLVSEVLPGATRFSSLFVFPIEMAVWGGGAVLIRAAVRHWRLGWMNMLLLALALAIAEECLIQQTSLAPLVIQIKGKVYARAFGINYLYLLWALAYESILVVFVPVALAELIFPHRRTDRWVNRVGALILGILFAAGAFLAWYSWTQIARTVVFHVAPYSPPLVYVLVAAFTIAALVFIAIGPFRLAIARPPVPRRPPAAWAVGLLGATWAVLWYAICLLAFGIAPAVPAVIPMAAGILMLVVILLLVPRWAAHADWVDRYRYAVIFGVMVGAMSAGFVGFIGSARLDLYFKIIVNLVAVVLLLLLGPKIGRTAGQRTMP
ncbi:MAG: hypothetical protein ACM36C_07440 [Acidobacteriota bacterium]